MTAFTNSVTIQRKYALIAGISLIIMAISAAFSYGFVQGELVISEEPVATLNKLTASSGLFLSGIFGWFVILLCDVVVVWALYIFFQSTHKNLALFGALLRLIYTAILGIAILNLVFISLLTSNDSLIQLSSNEQLPAIISLFFGAFHFIWYFGLIIFGIHLFVLGYLCHQSEQTPKIITILLYLAGGAYIVIHLLMVFFPKYDSVISIMEMVLTLPMITGELGLAIWLIIKGGKKAINS